MRLLAIGLMTVLVASLTVCLPSNLPLPEYPPTTTIPTQIPTPSLHPAQSPLALPSDCPHMPLGGFYDVWRNEQVWPRLGCAVALAEAVTGTEAYLCYATHSLWLREKRLFVVVISSGPWTFVPDESGLPPDVPLMVAPTPQLPKPTPGPTVTPVPTPTPVALLILPIITLTPSSHLTRLSIALPASELGLLPEGSPIETPTPPWPRGCFPATGRHGWLARTISDAEQGGGWSRSSETTFEGAMQQFEGGWLLWNGNVCFVLFADGRWTMF